MGLVLTIDDETGERLIAVARYVRVAAGSARAELAITVADDYQHRGAGTLLLQCLVDLTWDGGIRELVADVLADNRAMLDIIHAANLPCRERSEAGVFRIVMHLADA